MERFFPPEWRAHLRGAAAERGVWGEVPPILPKPASPVRRTGRALPPAAMVVAGREAASLERIAEPGVAAVLWTRALPYPARPWLDRLSLSAAPKLRAVLAPDEAAAALRGAFAAVHAVGPEADLVIDDIAALSAHFCALADMARADLRLEAVTGGCDRFHTDFVRLRMIVTYCGPGTQWPASAPGAWPLIGGGRPVEEAPRFAVLLFKGRDPGQPERSLFVHRSPPKEAGQRFVLCLSSVD